MSLVDGISKIIYAHQEMMMVHVFHPRMILAVDQHLNGTIGNLASRLYVLKIIKVVHNTLIASLVLLILPVDGM